MTKALEEFGANPGRSGHQMSMDTAEAIYECRREAASFFGAPSPDDVAFTINCTHAVNLALKGILKPGDHVVTSNLEHNAMMRPLEALRRKGISYTAAKVEPGDDDQTIRNFEEAIRPNTKMIACMHASNVFGVRLPIERLGELAKKRGLFFLVDAAQTAGILPIHMQEMGIDFLCIPGHKGLYGPMGTGMLVTDCGEKLDTLLEGGTGSRSVELTQPLYMPDRLESGTVNTPGRHPVCRAAGDGRHFTARNPTHAALLRRNVRPGRGTILYTPSRRHSHPAGSQLQFRGSAQHRSRSLLR